MSTVAFEAATFSICSRRRLMLADSPRIVFSGLLFPAQFFLEVAVLCVQANPFLGTIEHDFHLLGREGLHEEVDGAELHGFNGLLNGAKSRDHYHEGFNMVFLLPAQDIHATHDRHFDVDERDVEILGFHLFASQCAIIGLYDLDAGAR
jgi:hypothetical protein